MKIAIVGCGIGGLAVAGFLAGSNNDITLFDQFDKPAPVGFGLVIQPVGLRILEMLGAAPEALDKGAAGYRMLGYESDHKRKVLDVTYGITSGPNFGLGIHRASLFEALLNTCKAHGVHITNAHQVIDSHIDGSMRTLRFANGKNAGPFDLVIDASGAGSLISPLKSKDLYYGALWGTVDWPQNTILQYDRLEQRYKRACHMIGVLPIGSMPGSNIPKAALFWSLPQDAFKTWQNSPIVQWKDNAKALWPDIAPFVDQIKVHDDMTMARYSHGTMRKTYTDRLVHIGDAAHRASPQLGQGANMALLDAFALSHCLQITRWIRPCPPTLKPAKCISQSIRL